MRWSISQYLCATLAALACASVAASVSAQGSLLRLNDTELYVTIEGSGPPVILLHGGFMDSTMWKAQVRVLSREFQVITFDFRGYGKSRKPSGPYLPGDDIAAIMNHLNVRRAAVVGISMGGGVAIDFALGHPDRVSALVLAEPGLNGHQWSTDVTDTMDAVMKAHNERGRAAAVEEFLRRPVFATAKGNAAAYAAIREQLERNFSLEPNEMRALRPLAIARLPALKAPTLVMVAEHGGPDARAISRRIVSEVSGAQQMVVRNSGHMINLERPEQFNRIVTEFVQRPSERKRATPQTQSLLSIDRLDLKGVVGSSVIYRNRSAIRLLEADKSREGGLAIIEGVTFRDGTLEVDVAGRRGPYAVADDRGFIGLAFRISSHAERFEYIYLRPDNGRTDDQVRRNHSTQYAAHPDFPWPRMRKEFPEKYESYVDLEPGAWTRMRIVIAGITARLYVHDAPQPVLVVSDLKLGAKEGAVALWIGAGTEGFFSNLRITR